MPWRTRVPSWDLETADRELAERVVVRPVKRHRDRSMKPDLEPHDVMKLVSKLAGKLGTGDQGEVEPEALARGRRPRAYHRAPGGKNSIQGTIETSTHNPGDITGPGGARVWR